MTEHMNSHANGNTVGKMAGGLAGGLVGNSAGNKAGAITGNLGQSSLPRKRRAIDPMQAYDSLPAPLRHWLSQAALPWSPQSVRRIWATSRAKGLSDEETLQRLNRAEAQTLARDRQSSLALVRSES
jgi:hypothetical protein